MQLIIVSICVALCVVLCVQWQRHCFCSVFVTFAHAGIFNYYLGCIFVFLVYPYLWYFRCDLSRLPFYNLFIIEGDRMSHQGNGQDELTIELNTEINMDDVNGNPSFKFIQCILS